MRIALVTCEGSADAQDADQPLLAFVAPA